MTLVEAIILAVVSGLTGILPVSGTGHRLIVEKIFGLSWSDPALHVYRAMLYLGVGFALMLYYRRKLLLLLRELLTWLGLRKADRRRRERPLERREMLLTLFALIPSALLIVLRKYALLLESHENALPIAAAFLVVSGVFLYFSDRGFRKRRKATDLTLKNALITGAAQAASAFSGASRSAFTVSALLAADFERSCAVEFSCVLGIPVFFGAAISELMTASSLGDGKPLFWRCVLGLLFSLLAALYALRRLNNTAKRRRVSGYAFWCWGAGIVCIILFLIAA